MARVAVAIRTTIVRSDTAKLALSELGHPRPRRSEPHHGACPLRPESGQLSDRLEMSALCQKRTFALQQKAPLFDRLVGECDQRRWDAKRLATIEGDDEIEGCGQLHRHI